MSSLSSYCMIKISWHPNAVKVVDRTTLKWNMVHDKSFCCLFKVILSLRNYISKGQTKRLYFQCCIMMPYLLVAASPDCSICSHLSCELHVSCFFFWLHLVSGDWGLRYGCPLWPHKELISITRCYCTQFLILEVSKRSNGWILLIFSWQDRDNMVIVENPQCVTLNIDYWKCPLFLTISFKCFPSLPALEFMLRMRLQQKSVKVKSCT